jgi:parallel beta-helix repeat protein
MQLPINLAVDITENWEMSDTALGQSELAIELDNSSGESVKHLLVGDGEPVGPNMHRLRAKVSLIKELPPMLEELKGDFSEVQKSVADESARAVEAEGALSGAITTESARAVEAEGALSGAITTESARAVEAEGALSGAITAESARAVEAEGALSGAITTESARAVEAEGALNGAITTESARAVEAEGALDAAKPDRTELTAVLTNAVINGSANAIGIEFSIYNAQTKESTSITRNFPIVSETNMGAATREMYTSLLQAIIDIQSLKSAGGRWIGQNFETKAQLLAYTIPDTVNIGDWTDVIEDESRQNLHTRYAVVDNAGAKTFSYQYDVEQLPIGIATTTKEGVVLSAAADEGNAGQGYVEANGIISVIGWDDLNGRLSNLASNMTAHIADTIRHVTQAEKDAWNAKGEGSVYQAVKIVRPYDDTTSTADFTAGEDDANVAINAAIAALPGTGGKVILLPGNYTFNDRIIIEKSIILEGCGREATMLVKNFNKDNWVDNELIWVNNEWCSISNLSIEVNNPSVNKGYAIIVDGTNYTTIRDCAISGFKACAIFLSSDNHTHIEGCTIRDCTYGIGTDTTVWATIIGNNINNCNTDIMLSSSPSDCVVMGNVCKGATNANIQIEVASRCVVSGNICDRGSNIGIRIIEAQDCIITDNTCYNLQLGMYITDGAKRNIIKDNNITVISTSDDSCGIYIDGLNDDDNNTIVGNKINTRSGIYINQQKSIRIGNGAKNNFISGNYLNGKDVTDLSGNTSNLIYGNYVDGKLNIPNPKDLSAASSEAVNVKSMIAYVGANAPSTKYKRVKVVRPYDDTTSTADYTASENDAHAAIGAAVSAAGEGGTAILLPGTYTFNGGIGISTSCTIRGIGRVLLINYVEPDTEIPYEGYMFAASGGAGKTIEFDNLEIAPAYPRGCSFYYGNQRARFERISGLTVNFIELSGSITKPIIIKDSDINCVEAFYASAGKAYTGSVEVDGCKITCSSFAQNYGGLGYKFTNSDVSCSGVFLNTSQPLLVDGCTLNLSIVSTTGSSAPNNISVYNDAIIRNCKINIDYKNISSTSYYIGSAFHFEPALDVYRRIMFNNNHVVCSNIGSAAAGKQILEFKQETEYQMHAFILELNSNYFEVPSDSLRICATLQDHSLGLMVGNFIMTVPGRDYDDLFVNISQFDNSSSFGAHLAVTICNVLCKQLTEGAEGGAPPITG